MSKIKSTVIGFLKNAEYSFYYHGIFGDFENEFFGADSVSISLIGTVGGIMDYKEPSDPVQISEDSKTVQFKFEESSYIRGKSKVPVLPDSKEVLKNLRSILKSAAEDYKKKFQSEDQINPPESSAD